MSRRTSSKPWHNDAAGSSFSDPSAPTIIAAQTRKSTPILKKPSVASETSPLIPTVYLDVGQQRLLFVSLFFGIQAYKISEAVGSTIGSEAFLLKYLIIDAMFVWVLPIFRIPWLTFSNWVSFLQFILLIIFNIFLSTSSFSLSLLILAIWKSLFETEVSFSGSKVHQQDQVYDAKSHLLGKYTVNILPESTALLNPGLASYCVDSGASNLPISIPVRLNATDPIFVQLARIDFETLEETTYNFTRKELKSFKSSSPPANLIDEFEGLIEGIAGSGGSGSGAGSGAGSGSGSGGSGPGSGSGSTSRSTASLSYLSLPVSKPGLYRLKQVTDASNLDVRLYRSDVLVVSCPKAYIIGSEASDVSPDRCIGDVDTPKLVVDGVPPLRVKYSRSVKGRESLFSVQSLQPDHFTSPLLSGGATGSRFVWSKGDSLDWVQAKTVEVDLDTTLSTTGQWVYDIDEVEDAFGNIINYSALLQSGKNSALLSSKGLSYGFAVHPRPQIRFQGCDSVNPVKLPKGHQVQLPVSLIADANDGPFEATFDYSPLQDESNEYNNETSVFSHKFNSLGERLVISEPGIYSLREISGKYCSGDVIEPSSCLVFVPPEPTVEIKFDDIEDKCAGPTGVRADISLTGNPPFSLSYRVIKDGRIISTKTHDISKSREQLMFNPSEEGNYVYEFFSLSDDLYKGRPLQGDHFKKSQSIHVLAGASFAEKSIHTRRCCSGDSLKLKVDLNGIPPLKLNYEIVSGNSRKEQFSVSDINDMSYEIETPALTQGGRYTISLVSVQDSRGCVTPLNEADIVVEVRRQRPAAAFLPIDGSTKVKTLEGRSIGLPLRLSGKAPWTVSYKHIDEASGIEQDYVVNVGNANGDAIHTNQKGKYLITGVSDAYCPGDVSVESNTIDISWINKPSLSVVSTPSLSKVADNLMSRKNVCELEEDVFEISLEGKLSNWRVITGICYAKSHGILTDI
ncbi:Pom152p [Sugiyamaella lignohabitans]|uniref:Pom152p n=1 Tax=Sugiyamaella lignohabitans TaxID=796027 RepID=A0A167ELI3_9ASCO|nr:Pom152p [Sugiyamaella lignohabitans]ANB14218.1 Pom152p [Sugiyamaella lignohabitans]